MVDRSRLGADKAMDDGSVESVVTLLTDAMQKGLRAHFNEAFAAKRFNPDDVVAGREYVNAYV